VDRRQRGPASATAPNGIINKLPTDLSAENLLLCRRAVLHFVYGVVPGREPAESAFESACRPALSVFPGMLRGYAQGESAWIFSVLAGLCHSHIIKRYIFNDLSNLSKQTSAGRIGTT